MCGICGIIWKDNTHPINRDILESMNSELGKRGPDDSGYYIHNNVGIAHTRLSIIDLETGHQPIYNEDKTICVVTNGEIYNFKDIRTRFCAGHNFRTKSDAEVIVHLYEEKGINLLKYLNGMFAFALYDKNRETLFIARDRMGQKPLYYGEFNGVILFASEIKAIIKHPACHREIDKKALVQYLVHDYVPAPRSIFKNIRKLPAACYISIKNNNLTINEYWNFSMSTQETLIKENEVLYRLEFLYKEAVKKRLLSDVPIGVFLSGGVDSSSIVSFMKNLCPERIKTFSISFSEKSFDESKFSGIAAREFSTDHYDFVFDINKLLDYLPAVSVYLDEPFADPSILPTYLLSKETRSQVKVALGGDGGDELFGGYPTYPAHMLMDYLHIIAREPVKKIIEQLVDFIPTSDKNMSFEFKARKFLSGITAPPPIRNAIWLGSFSPQILKFIMTENYSSILSNDILYEMDIYHYNIQRNHSILDNILYTDTKMYLQDDILTKIDRASMANSLEVRSPFMDIDLVEFVTSLPLKYKIRNFKGKHIFKKMLKGRVPENIIHRSKKGFGIPVAKWLRGELRDMIYEYLSEKKLRESGIFNHAEITRMIDAHMKGRTDHRKPLWNLLMLMIWREKYA